MERGPFRGIVAITRGGLIPAAIIARELECRLVETVSVVTYEEESTRRAAGGEGARRGRRRRHAAGCWSTTWSIPAPPPGWCAALLPQAHFATVYAKPAGRPLVDSFITEVSQDTWILFPWDTEPQFVAPIARTRNGG